MSDARTDVIFAQPHIVQVVTVRSGVLAARLATSPEASKPIAIIQPPEAATSHDRQQN